MRQARDENATVSSFRLCKYFITYVIISTGKIKIIGKNIIGLAPLIFCPISACLVAVGGSGFAGRQQRCGLLFAAQAYGLIQGG